MKDYIIMKLRKTGEFVQVYKFDIIDNKYMALIYGNNQKVKGQGLTMVSASKLIPVSTDDIDRLQRDYNTEDNIDRLYIEEPIYSGLTTDYD